jgi:LSD1 subclass zinc finger protein
MNRRVTLVGLFFLLLAIAFIASPIPLTGAERITTFFEIGLMGLPVGLCVILYGLSSPDPDVTTVGGTFGNPDENVLARQGRRAPPVSHVRYASSPKEPVHCRHCYTLIPWDITECPRCHRRRECRGCGRPLFYLSGAVRCAPCVRDEVYCSCPKLRRNIAPPGSRPRSLGR